MAQPHQYHGEGGAAPAYPGEGTVSYVDSYKAPPFPTSTETLVPGEAVEVARATIMRFTQANGTVRQTIPQSITQNPPQHTEYGRTAAN